MKKLRTMSPMSAEATVVRNYLDWLLSIPWNKPTKVKRDIKLAEKGPRTKTITALRRSRSASLNIWPCSSARRRSRGRSCASSVLRASVRPRSASRSRVPRVAPSSRISLGGVRDEAEIRGHRRTYIGSMPGKIIQAMKKAKSSNPLFLLDEIDKLGSDYRGDPSSALLEVLDPEQNVNFNDHYLEVDYDLSDVMFITTANSLRMAQPLLDRMEIIRIPGYTEDEKVEIAMRHLVPKQIKDHGLKKGEWLLLGRRGPRPRALLHARSRCA